MKTQKRKLPRRRSSERGNSRNTSEPFRENNQADFNVDDATRFLENLKKDSRYPKEWLNENIEALQTNDYQPLAKLFYDLKFIGKNRDFAIAAPFTVLRGAEEVTKLSVLEGKVIYVPEIKNGLQIVEKIQGTPLREQINKLLAVKTTLATGNFDGQNGGEAFIVPDGWAWAKDNKEYVLPAINNATEQYRRRGDGIKKIYECWDFNTAKIFTAPLKNWKSFVKVQNLEYLAHDIGHHSGIGLNIKLGQNLLSNYWLQGQEEWRADAIDFSIVIESFSEEEAKEIIASNFVTRFGSDAHRSGGIDSDYDVVVVHWLLQHLLQNGSLQIKNGKLSIRNIATNGLIEAVKSAIAEGIAITKEELALERNSGLARIYAFKLENATREIFEEFIIKPCKNLPSNLR
jgi:Family of unknown function (DUF6014)